MEDPARRALVAAVQRALDDTAAEYAQMPFVVRMLVRRGFVKRTGRDFAGWQALLANAARADDDPDLVSALTALAEHCTGAPLPEPGAEWARPRRSSSSSKRNRAHGPRP